MSIHSLSLSLSIPPIASFPPLKLTTPLSRSHTIDFLSRQLEKQKMVEREKKMLEINSHSRQRTEASGGMATRNRCH